MYVSKFSVYIYTHTCKYTYLHVYMGVQQDVGAGPRQSLLVGVMAASMFSKLDTGRSPDASSTCPLRVLVEDSGSIQLPAARLPPKSPRGGPG